MRLAGFVVAILVFASSIFIAQHTFAAGGSSSTASDGGSHGGGSSSSGSASHSSAPSVSHSTAASAGGSKTAQPSRVANTKGNAGLERKTGRSLLHPFRKPKPVERAGFRRPCLKEPCSVCPPGGSRFGKCVVTSTCLSGQVWNGFSCVASNWWFNDCSELAAQLAAQARHMRGTNDPGQAFVYQMLKREYDSCMERGGRGFGSYAIEEARLFDIP